MEDRSRAEEHRAGDDGVKVKKVAMHDTWTIIDYNKVLDFISRERRLTSLTRRTSIT